MRQCAYDGCKKPIEETAAKKRIFCSDACRNKAHTTRRQAQPGPLTLEDIKSALLTFKDQEAIKRLCHEILSMTELRGIPLTRNGGRVLNLSPDFDQVPQQQPSYLPDPPVLQPQGHEPKPGSIAHYMKYGY